MPNKKLILLTILVLPLLSVSSTKAQTDESLPENPADAPEVTPTRHLRTIEPSTRQRRQLQPQEDGKNISVNIAEIREGKANRLRISKARHAEIKSRYKDRLRRLEVLKQDRRSKFKELKEKHVERVQLRKEELQDKFNEIQVKRLERIKRHSGLVEARLQKAAEHLYTALERISNHLEKQKEAGFDISEHEKQLDSIEAKIAEAEAKIEQLGPLYENIEGLTPQDVPTTLNDMKSISMDIASDYKEIRQEIVNLIRSIK